MLGFTSLIWRYAVSISYKTVTKIASLAKIKLSEDETRDYGEQLSDILQHVKAIDDVDVKNVSPMFYGCLDEHNLRDPYLLPFYILLV